MDGVSARQFAGAEESLLHKELKRIVGELLEIDPATERGSVIVDQFLVAKDGRRKPDVRAVYDGRPIAIEIQLATTQIPIIMARESFYEREKRGLLWLTWQFEPVIRSRMPTAFEDIFYSHNKNLFSIDREVIDRSRSERRLHIRAYWERDNAWRTSLFSLQALTWPEAGLPYAVAPTPPWHVDFRNRWIAVRDSPTVGWKDEELLLNEVGEQAGLPWSNHYEFVEEEILELIDCLVSLHAKRPVGSRQKNLSELLNTFLAPRERHRFARLVWYAMKAAGLAELRQRPSIERKFTAARAVEQDDRESPAGKLALAVFPEWFSALSR
nr:DUF6035 family protein [Nitrosomonas nitrosa]